MFMCTHLYVCLCACMCINVSVYVCACVYICVYICVYACVYMCVYASVYMCVHMHLCTHVCMRVTYMRVHMCVMCMHACACVGERLSKAFRAHTKLLRCPGSQRSGCTNVGSPDSNGVKGAHVDAVEFCSLRIVNSGVSTLQGMAAWAQKIPGH